MTTDDPVDLGSIVDRALKKTKFGDLRDEAKRGNIYGYQELLTRFVRDALADMKAFLAVQKGIDGDKVILSFHYSSLILRGWLRIEESRRIWRKFTQLRS